MKEDVNFMLKCKVWKLVRMQLNLMHVGGIKHEINLEFLEEDLGNANRILGMEMMIIKRSRNLLLCQRQNLDKLMSKNGKSNSKLVYDPLGYEVVMINKGNS